MEDRTVVACMRYSGDDLDIEAIHPSQWKTIKKKADGDQIDGYRYSTHGPRSKGRYQPLSEASATNRQKFDNCEHAADRLRSDSCVATDDNIEGCC